MRATGAENNDRERSSARSHRGPTRSVMHPLPRRNMPAKSTSLARPRVAATNRYSSTDPVVAVPFLSFSLAEPPKHRHRQRKRQEIFEEPPSIRRRRQHRRALQCEVHLRVVISRTLPFPGLRASQPLLSKSSKSMMLPLQSPPQEESDFDRQ